MMKDSRAPSWRVPNPLGQEEGQGREPREEPGGPRTPTHTLVHSDWPRSWWRNRMSPQSGSVPPFQQNCEKREEPRETL